MNLAGVNRDGHRCRAKCGIPEGLVCFPQSPRFCRWWWCNRIVLSQLNKLNRHNSAQLDYDFVTCKNIETISKGVKSPPRRKWQKWHTPRKRKKKRARRTGGKWGIKKYHVKCIRFCRAEMTGKEKQIAQFFVPVFREKACASGNLFIYDYLLRGKPGTLRVWTLQRVIN